MLRGIADLALWGLILRLAVDATPGAAQKLSLSPNIGVYIPTSELVKAANGQEFKQEIALAVGGRLGLNFSPRFGIVTSVAYVPSSLRFTFDQNETKTDANLLFGTARANFQVIPWTSPVWLGLNAGASLVKRGGAAYEDAEDKTDIGGVIGTTVGFNLGGLLSFYVAAEDTSTAPLSWNPERSRRSAPRTTCSSPLALGSRFSGERRLQRQPELNHLHLRDRDRRQRLILISNMEGAAELDPPERPPYHGPRCGGRVAPFAEMGQDYDR